MEKNKNVNIVVETDGKQTTFIAATGENLLNVLRRNGVMVPATCGGKGTCGKCRVEMADEESVLSCQYELTRDIQVKVPDMNYFVILDELNPHARRVTNDCGLRIVKKENSVDILYKEKHISRLDDRKEVNILYGLAIDIGTTTIAVYLVDLFRYEVMRKKSFLNPQGAYGADVISRIEYTIQEKNGLSILQTSLLNKLNENITLLCTETGIQTDDIYLTTIVGNTVMLHVLLGVDPKPIAFAPYTPAFTEEKNLRGHQSGLNMHPEGCVRLLPSVAGYVGADIVAGVAATDILDRESHTLYIDIGTNGEIVMGNSTTLYCCATAAGPAFEGARIECGVGGIQGAISEYEGGQYLTIGRKKPVGICGSGLIDIVAFLLDEKIIDPSGLMEQDFLLEKREKTAVDRDIILTQKDVREVQLAKAAIYAGIRTLMGVSGITFETIDAVYLAGGFGNYIRPESAVRTGLLPAELADRIIPVGNSAGTGALLALKSADFEQETQRVLDRMQYIELSMRPDFNDFYVDSMFFPSRDG